jgi:3-hydroxybutyryl-CoA dehydratase
VRIGDTVIARATVSKLNQERKRVTLLTTCQVGDIKVMDGEAMLMVPRRPGNGA